MESDHAHSPLWFTWIRGFVLIRLGSWRLWLWIRLLKWTDYGTVVCTIWADWSLCGVRCEVSARYWRNIILIFPHKDFTYRGIIIGIIPNVWETSGFLSEGGMTRLTLMYCFNMKLYPGNMKPGNRMTQVHRLQLKVKQTCQPVAKAL